MNNERLENISAYNGNNILNNLDSNYSNYSRVLPNKYIFDHSFVDVNEQTKPSVSSTYKRGHLQMNYIQPRNVDAEIVPFVRIKKL